MIKTPVLLRLSGLAALAGGLLRMATALPLSLSPAPAELLYDVIDVLLLLGLMGIYLVRAEALGFLGLAAFVLGVGALSFIGGPDADPFGFSTYQEGASVLALAMVGLALAWIGRGQRPRAAPVLWFASVIAASVLGLLPAPLPSYGLTAAGALFGAGFAMAGLDLIGRERVDGRAGA